MRQKTQVMSEQAEVWYTVELLDGRIAQCWEAGRQEYKNCVFSTGLVDDIPPDTLYLRMHRDGEDEPTYVFLRPDEAQAIVHLLAGALWSLSILETT